MHSDDLVVRVIVALVRLQDDLGQEAFEDVSMRTLRSIAEMRIRHAEVPVAAPTGKVVRFVPRRGRTLHADDPDDEPA